MEIRKTSILIIICQEGNDLIRAMGCFEYTRKPLIEAMIGVYCSHLVLPRQWLFHSAKSANISLATVSPVTGFQIIDFLACNG